MTPDFEQLRKRFGGELESELLDALEEAYGELERRESALIEREAKVDKVVRELEALASDLEVTDNHARYEGVETYEKGDETFVVASELPDREVHVLSTLQRLSERDSQGRLSVIISNKELIKETTSMFDPVTMGALTACLTRLTHKGLIFTEHLNGQGYPRRIVLTARLESPDAFDYVP